MQIADVFDRLFEPQRALLKLPYDVVKDFSYQQAMVNVLVQQQSSLLQLATYLIDNSNVATSVDYNTFATANANVGTGAVADVSVGKSITSAKGDLYKSLATRRYAWFLFSQRRYEDGRRQFANAILKGSDNPTRYTNGYTYQMWAICERQFAGSTKRQEELVESATNEYKGIDILPVREKSLNDLITAVADLEKNLAGGVDAVLPPPTQI
jgi:hypothetical protein